MNIEEPAPAAPDPRDDAYDDLLYARGFLLTDRPRPEVPAFWARREIGGWGLWHDPRLDCREAEARGALPLRGPARVLCLGVILDADRPEDGPDAVLSRLAGRLARSEAAMLRALDTAAGRFVLIYRRGGRTCVVGDAAGTKQVFRHRHGAVVVASHLGLAERNVEGATRIPHLVFKMGFPGFDTNRRRIRILTPNTRLCLEDGGVERFWPRRAVPALEVERAAEEAARLMRNTIAHLAGRFDLHMSVTAGLDSRVTLSLLGDLPCSLFTYYRADDVASDAHDLDFIEAYRRGSGRPTRLFRLRERSIPSGFRRSLAANTIRSHVQGVAWLLHDGFPSDGAQLHLRSNLSEIGRQFYGMPRWNDRPASAEFARLHLSLQRGVRPPAVYDAIERFERFARVTGIVEAGRRADLASLFYWEHRMASWLANCLTESDAGMDTVSPYNCRRLLEALLGVPPEVRSTAAVHRAIVAARAPELTRLPVNGRALW